MQRTVLKDISYVHTQRQQLACFLYLRRFLAANISVRRQGVANQPTCFAVPGAVIQTQNSADKTPARKATAFKFTLFPVHIGVSLRGREISHHNSEQQSA